MTKDHYCIGCKMRLHNRTDKPGFCDAGYTQIPVSVESTMNLLRNGGTTCSKNPWKGRAIDEIVKVEKQCGMLDVSGIVTYCV